MLALPSPLEIPSLYPFGLFRHSNPPIELPHGTADSMGKEMEQ